MLGVHHNICYTIFTNKYFYVIIGSDWHCMFFLNKKTTLEKFRAINFQIFSFFMRMHDVRERSQGSKLVAVREPMTT